MNIVKITTYNEFNKIKKHGKKIVFDGFVFLFYRDVDLKNMIRLGIITSSKVGNAVVRNRVRRRLKAAIYEILQQFSFDGFYICLIARKKAFSFNFKLLKQDLSNAIKEII